MRTEVISDGMAPEDGEALDAGAAKLMQHAADHYRKNHPSEPALADALGYHDVDRVSHHRLEKFRHSPPLYASLCVWKTMLWDEPTDVMTLGTCGHAWLLEPHRFEELVQLIPEEVLAKNGSRNTGLYRQFASENVGKALLKESEWERVKRIRRKVLEHPVARALIENADGFVERAVCWDCQHTQLACKTLPDLVTKYKGRTVVADFKITNDHRPRPFGKRIADMGYHRQIAFQWKGLVESMQAVPCSGVLIVANKDAPYTVRVYEVSGMDLAAAAEQNRLNLHRLKKCYDTGVWQEPGEDEIGVIELPNYARDLE